MVTRAQLDRLSARIDALADRVAPPEGPYEVWLLEADRAWQPPNEEDAISAAELAARRPAGPRVLVRFVHADDGRPAECCMLGGACRAVDNLFD